jgi:hypothetical protein
MAVWHHRGDLGWDRPQALVASPDYAERSRYLNRYTAESPSSVTSIRTCPFESSQEDVTVEFRRVEYDVEAVGLAIRESELPEEFAAQLLEARGYSPVSV